MKLNEFALANSLAILTAVIYVVCAALVAVLPDLFKAISASWFHGIDIESLWTGSPRGDFLLGLVSAVAASWGAGWLFAKTYNRLAK